MDSITQIALGAGIAALAAPKSHVRKALLIGAALGTLPDLDVLVRYADPVANMTKHRSFSHSLLILTPFSILLWATLRRYWEPVAKAPGPWLAAIMLALITHPLLDAHTVYGTQLFWPFRPEPAMWSTIFIIDPLYTLPLAAAALFAAIRPSSRQVSSVLIAGMLLSHSYLGWTWIAKAKIDAVTERTLSDQGLSGTPFVSGPAPLNSLLWRVVVRTEQGYLEGFYSLASDDGPIQFRAYASNEEAIKQARALPAVQRLIWFSSGFIKAEVIDRELIISDLRMGQEPSYFFRHAVARKDAQNQWQAIKPKRLSFARDTRALSQLWDRIWLSEAQFQAAIENSGETPATSASK